GGPLRASDFEQDAFRLAGGFDALAKKTQLRRGHHVIPKGEEVAAERGAIFDLLHHFHERRSFEFVDERFHASDKFMALKFRDLRAQFFSTPSGLAPGLKRPTYPPCSTRARFLPIKLIARGMD